MLKKYYPRKNTIAFFIPSFYRNLKIVIIQNYTCLK